MSYYKRQIELWGEETQESLKSKSVAIIGSGGLGCSVAIALSGSGIGKIVLVDFDKVSVHNIHRQIGFDIDDEDKYKSEVLAKKIEARNSDVEVVSIVGSFDDFAHQDIECDLIIDATDNLPVRAKIDEYAKSKSICWIYGSVEEFHGQVCFFDKSKFSDGMIVSDHKPGGIACPIVMQIASFEANLALRYLANLSVAKDTLYYFSFNKDGIFENRKFKMPN
jgi:adenylyltransferase/sulfurtransferase